MKKTMQLRKTVVRVCFVLYLCMLIRFIVLKYPLAVLTDIVRNWGIPTIGQGLEKANFKIFRSIILYIKYYQRINGFDNLIGNIGAFIPFGILFGISFPEHSSKFFPLLYCGLFSLFLELVQLITGFGIFDIDDIILNTLGGLLGCCIFYLFGRKKKGNDAEQEAKSA